jgi:hypothetical protein
MALWQGTRCEETVRTVVLYSAALVHITGLYPVFHVRSHLALEVVSLDKLQRLRYAELPRS